MRAVFVCLIVFAAGHALAASACPSQEFEKFLEAYSESEDLQKQFTRFPLAVKFMVENSAIAHEPIPVSAALRAEHAVFPLLPSAGAQKDDEWSATISGEGNARVVQYAAPDTDHAFALHFEKTRGCWQLIMKDATSL